MHIVFDASAFDVVYDSTLGSAGAQIQQWIDDGHGRVAYSTYGRVGRELELHSQLSELVHSYTQAGLAEPFGPQEIQEHEARLKAYGTKSGESDLQVLALAAASDARVMVVRDRRLRMDFEDADLLLRTPKPWRKAFPINESPARRNDFLHRRRCPQRLQ